MGSARIRQELQAKGLPGEAIQEAVAKLQDSELDRARGVWERKFAQPPQTPQENAKQTRFLLTRGFSGDVVRRVLRGTVDGDGGENA
ncbi:Regulatory protein RecX [compost metagenome]